MNRYDYIALAVAALGLVAIGIGYWIVRHDRKICRWVNELEE